MNDIRKRRRKEMRNDRRSKMTEETEKKEKKMYYEWKKGWKEIRRQLTEIKGGAEKKVEEK